MPMPSPLQTTLDPPGLDPGTVQKYKHNQEAGFGPIDYAKTFDCVDHNKLWKILKEMGIPDLLDLPLGKPTCRSGSNS